MLRPDITNLADKYLVRCAAQQAVLSVDFRGSRTASDTAMLREVLTAMGDEFYLPHHRGKVAFGGLVKVLAQIAGAFKKLPTLWAKFKKLVGIESLSDIPAAIKHLVEEGKKKLKSALHALFETWPLKIYTIEKGKLKGINDLLDGLVSKSPKLKAMLASAHKHIGDFGEMVRKKAPHIMGLAMVGIYIWVWINTTEFEWDLKSLTDAISGALTFPDFLATLPGAAMGALLAAFGINSYTLLPITLVARVLYMVQHRYIEWESGGFKVDWTLVRKDFGIDPQPV